MREYLDQRTGEWLPRDEYLARTETPDLYTALRGRRQPRGLREVTPPPATYGKSGKFRDPVLHQIERVIEGTWRDDSVLAAKYVCGGETVVLVPITEPGTERRCEKCFSDKTWHVYGYWNPAGDALYVGQTSDLRARRKSHRSSSPWYADAVWHDVLSTHSTATAALTAERAAIARLAPIHNVHHNAKAVAA